MMMLRMMQFYEWKETVLRWSACLEGKMLIGKTCRELKGPGA